MRCRHYTLFGYEETDEERLQCFFNIHSATETFQCWKSIPTTGNATQRQYKFIKWPNCLATNKQILCDYTLIILYITSISTKNTLFQLKKAHCKRCYLSNRAHYVTILLLDERKKKKQFAFPLRILKAIVLFIWWISFILKMNKRGPPTQMPSLAD